VPAFDRTAWLQSIEKTPAIAAYQLQLHTQTLFTQDDPQTALKLQAALQRAQMRSSSGITTGTLDHMSVRSTSAIELGSAAEFDHWLHSLVRESAGMLAHHTMQPYRAALHAIFDALTDTGPSSTQRRYHLQAPQDEVRRLVRLAFWRLREFATEVQPLDQAQTLLLLTHGKLPASTIAHAKLYPQAADVQKIVAADAQHQRGAAIAQADEAAFAAARALLEQQGLGHMLAAKSEKTAPAELATKDQSFHYLPYDFAQSGLELGLLQALLKATEFQASGLELYYNGARHLTEFRIDCFQQVNSASGNTPSRWQRLGAYTPDFVMLQRGEGGAAHKVLMIETKGAGFSEQSGYALRKRFVSTEFLRLNNAKFGYPRFDFIEIMEPAHQDYRSAAFALLSHAQRFFALSHMV
jgi:hypothetical protein